MNSQDFLTLNLVGAGIFIFWYLISRGGAHRPTQLNMKAQDSTPPLIPPVSLSEEKGRRTKALNVMFNYNGHSWDAYEVLGIPAGSSLMSVTEAYQTALRRCDASSMEFLETAYKAILNKTV
ncbi:MAG: hypothetical protein AAGB31_07145 [Bdellovibrio sp.]